MNYITYEKDNKYTFEELMVLVSGLIIISKKTNKKAIIPKHNYLIFSNMYIDDDEVIIKNIKKVTINIKQIKEINEDVRIKNEAIKDIFYKHKDIYRYNIIGELIININNIMIEYNNFKQYLVCIYIDNLDRIDKNIIHIILEMEKRYNIMNNSNYLIIYENKGTNENIKEINKQLSSIFINVKDDKEKILNYMMMVDEYILINKIENNGVYIPYGLELCEWSKYLNDMSNKKRIIII